MSKKQWILLLLVIIGVLVYITQPRYHLANAGIGNQDQLDQAVPDNQTLKPGSYVIGKYPFYISVGDDESVSITEHIWSYEVRRFKTTVIPPGQMGILTNKEDGSTNRLYSGTYRIDLNKYDVEIAKANSQLYIFGRKVD